MSGPHLSHIAHDADRRCRRIGNCHRFIAHSETGHLQRKHAAGAPAREAEPQEAINVSASHMSNSKTRPGTDARASHMLPHTKFCLSEGMCCGKQQILVRQCELSALGSKGPCEGWCMPWIEWRDDEIPVSHSSDVLHSLWCGRHLLEGRVDWRGWGLRRGRRAQRLRVVASHF